jgi:hypothetical protein
VDERVLETTRRALHGVAESLIAGPQYRADGTIRLKVTPDGFAGVTSPLRVQGTELVGPDGRWPLRGTLRELAELAGVGAGPPEGLYSDTSGVGLDEPLTFDGGALALLEDWFVRGDEALRAFAPESDPVLWPEHFDLAIVLDEVNYGVSPGDAGHRRPYAYVGPWTPREGEFWNAPFGAIRDAEDLPDAAAVAAFFTEGRRHLDRPACPATGAAIRDAVRASRGSPRTRPP